MQNTKNAIDKVGMSAFYEKHGPDAYCYHDFEETGVEISGGEAQKIAMARAIYKDGAIMILDEPTAALDPVSEYEIYSHFDRMIAGKTTIFISHRLSSCKFCDTILVMDSGKIIETGTHNELLKNPNGKYSELWTAQAQHYNEHEKALLLEH